MIEEKISARLAIHLESSLFEVKQIQAELVKNVLNISGLKTMLECETMGGQFDTQQAN